MEFCGHPEVLLPVLFSQAISDLIDHVGDAVLDLAHRHGDGLANLDKVRFDLLK